MRPHFDEVFSDDMFVEPFKEMVAYEALWSKIDKPTFKKVSEKLQNALPSKYGQFIESDVLNEISEELRKYDLNAFNTLIAGTASYPEELKKLLHFLPILYYKGDVNLLEMPAVSIVGSRKTSNRGIEIASEFASKLVHHEHAVVSGLAEGIDTAAHKSAIRNGGKTIAVIGTPLNESYPKENIKLQELIKQEHLLISQVPFIRYATNKKTNFRMNAKLFFPERNKTMAALTKATIIVEASNTSGTLIQARECLRMGKKLIIHAKILENKSITWPQNYIKRDNVYVVESFDEVPYILLA